MGMKEGGKKEERRQRRRERDREGRRRREGGEEGERKGNGRRRKREGSFNKYLMSSLLPSDVCLHPGPIVVQRQRDGATAPRPQPCGNMSSC